MDGRVDGESGRESPPKCHKRTHKTRSHARKDSQKAPPGPSLPWGREASRGYFAGRSEGTPGPRGLHTRGKRSSPPPYPPALVRLMPADDECGRSMPGREQDSRVWGYWPLLPGLAKERGGRDQFGRLMSDLIQ